jgi:hypothetical protein
MTTRFLFLTAVAAALAVALAGPVSARVEPGGGVGGTTKQHGTPKSAPVAPTSSSSTSSSSTEVEADDPNEATGTATTDGSAVTVTRADGTSITCSVPAGVDLTPFLTGNVKAECESVNGVLTLRELESETGAQLEVRDDGTVETDDEAADGDSVLEASSRATTTSRATRVTRVTRVIRVTRLIRVTRATRARTTAALVVVTTSSLGRTRVPR